MMKRDFDVAVVGGGFGGSVAACRAQELGARTLLIEASDLAAKGGNSPLSGGTIHAVGRTLTDNHEDLKDGIVDATSGLAHPELVEKFVRNAARSIRWLSATGISLLESAEGSVLLPPRQFDHRDQWEQGGPYRALQILHQRFVAIDGDLREGWRVESVDRPREDGSFLKIRAMNRDRSIIFLAKTAILADGGFQANKELLAEFVGHSAGKLMLRGTERAQGDGLQIARRLGADLTHMQFFYGHCMHREASWNGRLWAMPLLDDLAVQGVVVDEKGARPVDESLGGIAIANQLARLQSLGSLFVVADAIGWDLVINTGSRHPRFPGIDQLEDRGASVYRAPTIKDLAERMGVDSGGLQKAMTVRGEEAKASGRQSLRPPYVGVPMVPAITFTMGGVRVNHKAQVVSPDGDVLEGLLAAGGTMGGLQGGPRGGYVGGLAEALVFGLLAGETAAHMTKSTA